MLSLEKAHKRRDYINEALAQRKARHEELKRKGDAKSGEEKDEHSKLGRELADLNTELRNLISEKPAHVRMHHALLAITNDAPPPPTPSTASAQQPSSAHPMAGLSVAEIEAIVERKFIAVRRGDMTLV